MPAAADAARRACPGPSRGVIDQRFFGPGATGTVFDAAVPNGAAIGVGFFDCFGFFASLLPRN
jgi:hypothetical protein